MFNAALATGMANLDDTAFAVTYVIKQDTAPMAVNYVFSFGGQAGTSGHNRRLAHYYSRSGTTYPLVVEMDGRTALPPFSANLLVADTTQWKTGVNVVTWQWKRSATLGLVGRPDTTADSVQFYLNGNLVNSTRVLGTRYTAFDTTFTAGNGLAQFTFGANRAGALPWSSYFNPNAKIMEMIVYRGWNQANFRANEYGLRNKYSTP